MVLGYFELNVPSLYINLLDCLLLDAAVINSSKKCLHQQR
jgi:hypothetical protein